MARAARAAVPVASLVAAAIAATIHLRAQAPQSSPADAPRLVAMVLELPTASARDRERVEAGAQEAVKRLNEWLGPLASPSLHIVSKSARAEGEPAAPVITIDVPWLSAPETMDLESQVAFGVARQWWAGLRRNADTAAVADGLAWYLQSRIVDRLYDLNFLVPAHSADGVRSVGRMVPRAFSILPLGRLSGGLAREEYLRSRLMARDWPIPARRLPPGLSSSAMRNAIAFATLEQLAGWPALQGSLRRLAEEAGQRPLRRDEIEQIIASALGQDLSWFFPLAFDERRRVDYAVRELTTGEVAPCGRGPCFKTRVTLVREGDGEFTGSAAAASSAFETGDAIELRVAFADGQSTSTRWDGRAPSRTFEFDSAAAATSATIDPEHIVLLDENLLNNAIVQNANPQLVVSKWVAYWMVWLEGAMLDYGGLF